MLVRHRRLAGDGDFEDAIASKLAPTGLFGVFGVVESPRNL
jgi:hypothetical protein